jgi:hypothetical protein
VRDYTHTARQGSLRNIGSVGAFASISCELVENQMFA